MKSKIKIFKLITDFSSMLCFLYIITIMDSIKYNIIVGKVGICISIIMFILDLKEYKTRIKEEK